MVTSLTQWFVQMFIITAGPRLLAGFMLPPVDLNWNKAKVKVIMCKQKQLYKGKRK